MQDGEVVGIDAEDAEALFQNTAFVFVGGFHDKQSSTIYIARCHKTEHRVLCQEEVLFSTLVHLRRMWQNNAGAGKEEFDQAMDAEAFALAFIANKTSSNPDLFVSQMEVYPDDEFFLRANTLSFLYFPGSKQDRLVDFLSIMQKCFWSATTLKKTSPHTNRVYN